MFKTDPARAPMRSLTYEHLTSTLYPPQICFPSTSESNTESALGLSPAGPNVNLAGAGGLNSAQGGEQAAGGK